MSELPTAYSPLVRALLDRAAICHQPASGTFELTNRCNLACRMCYVRDCSVDLAGQQNELRASEWLTLSQQARDNGLVFLTLTGGEVLLRQDFFEIYEPLTRMGFVLTLLTNGTLITESVAERLAESPPNVAKITIYGATKAAYKAVTGVADAYDRCCAGVEELIAHGIPLGLKTTITRQNAHELESMQQMARNWGVPLTASWLLCKRRDEKASDVENCRLSAVEGVALEACDHAFLDEWSEARKAFAEDHGNFYCRAGRATFAVTPFGEMNVCLNLPLPAVLPLKIGFHPAWDRLRAFVESAPTGNAACAACDARGYCQLCPGWSYCEDGTLENPVPYLCEIARERKKVNQQIGSLAAKKRGLLPKT